MKAREARDLARKLRERGILTVETYRGSGAGGQHRNKTDSGVRLTGTWTVNGEPVTVKAQSCLKSQHSSMRAALTLLLARLAAHVRQLSRRERGTESGWSGKYVRTYHEPDNRVVDHASEERRTWAETVGKRDLGPLIEARRDAMLALDEGSPPCDL